MSYRADQLQAQNCGTGHGGGGGGVWGLLMKNQNFGRGDVCPKNKLREKRGRG